MTQGYSVWWNAWRISRGFLRNGSSGWGWTCTTRRWYGTTQGTYSPAARTPNVVGLDSSEPQSFPMKSCDNFLIKSHARKIVVQPLPARPRRCWCATVMANSFEVVGVDSEGLICHPALIKKGSDTASPLFTTASPLGVLTIYRYITIYLTRTHCYRLLISEKVVQNMRFELRIAFRIFASLPILGLAPRYSITY